ncbi:MAG: 16S rRNA (cytidine(1402)-2'-O)-methyltransferase [Rickettsiales bacterium]|nr:16S rRNA (cytidine(1402)-2'-O)-methyltransferase [Rickettsiales bacterium]
MALNNQSQITKFLQNQKLENALYIVPTPIGNLEDITMRALRVLKECDVVVCEDSRVTSKLLGFYEIKSKKFIIYNENSSVEARKKILHELLSNKSVALVSDAGTPIISDPGHKLIRFLKDEFKQKIIPLPGACALTTAICASGIAANNFVFLGFLPTSNAQKEAAINNLPRDVSFVFYESPNRVLKSLKLLQNILGERRIALARELTKLHEEIVVDQSSKIIELLKEGSIKQKGEFVILVEKIDKKDDKVGEEDLIRLIKQDLKKTGSPKVTSGNLSKMLGISKKEIYNMALELK